jgi:hypothetical protein
VQNAIHKQKRAAVLTCGFLHVWKEMYSTIETKANWSKMLRSPAPQTISNALGNIVTTRTSFGSQDEDHIDSQREHIPTVML